MTERRPLDRYRGSLVAQGQAHRSSADAWDATRIGGAVMASLAIVLRGLLVTTTAVAIVAFLLLTNSHI